MSRPIFFIIACLATAPIPENDNRVEVHFSERVSPPLKSLIKKQEIRQAGKPLAISSSVFSLRNRALNYQTLKISLETDKTIIEVRDPKAKSRAQFLLVNDTIIFAQCDLDDNGTFEIIVLYKNGLPHMAFRRNQDGTLTNVEGSVWEKVKFVCQTGSAPK